MTRHEPNWRLICSVLLSVAAVVVIVVVMVSAAFGQWYDYSPPGSVNGQGILRDVVSRCDERGRQAAADSDLAGFCHEATHMVNSRIRQLAGGTGNVNVAYVGGGVCVIFREPRVTLRMVAECIPRQYWTNTFPTEMQFQYWDQEPLYVLDEWAAYANGLQAANELGHNDTGRRDRALWFCNYADCLVEAIRRHDPQYEQLAELEVFVAWHTGRVKALAGESP